MGKLEAGSPDSTPPEDWMIEDRRSTKLAQEQGVGGEMMKEEDYKQAGPKKMKKVVRVQQGYIDHLLANPSKPFRGMPRELLDRDTSRHREKLRAIMAHATALHKVVYDRDMDILEQYKRQGFAEEVIEVVVEEELAVGKN